MYTPHWSHKSLQLIPVFGSLQPDYPFERTPPTPSSWSRFPSSSLRAPCFLSFFEHAEGADYSGYASTPICEDDRSIVVQMLPSPPSTLSNGVAAGPGSANEWRWHLQATARADIYCTAATAWYVRICSSIGTVKRRVYSRPSAARLVNGAWKAARRLEAPSTPQGPARFSHSSVAGYTKDLRGVARGTKILGEHRARKCGEPTRLHVQQSLPRCLRGRLHPVRGRSFSNSVTDDVSPAS